MVFIKIIYEVNTMNRISNKIICGSDGQNLHFFYSKNEGICILDENGEKALLKNACSDFDVCRLGTIIYLICQNHDGDIILLKYFDNAWHKYTLLVSKTKESYSRG